VLSGGTRPNVIADKARAELQIRLGIDIEHVKKVLEDVVRTRAWLEYSSAHNPVRLHSVPGFDECVVRFTTDVPYLSEWGKPLLLGPGSILDAHTAHERISKNELAGVVSLYTTMARQLLPQMNTD
jgi:acetylornithine deacetylase